MKSNIFKCSVCGLERTYNGHSFTTGYGRKPGNNHKVCYDCCAKRDLKELRETGKGYLYLVVPSDKPWKNWKLTNWPGSLEIMPCGWKEAERGHNWGLKRRDVWFILDGHYWHGVLYGDNTQVCKVEKTKSLAPYGGKEGAHFIDKYGDGKSPYNFEQPKQGQPAA
jgi:hypothetical protein